MKVKDLIKLGIITEETDIVQYTTREEIINKLDKDFGITKEVTEEFETIVDACCNNAYENLIGHDEIYYNIAGCLDYNGWNNIAIKG